MISDLERKKGLIEPGHQLVDEIVDPVSGDHVFIVHSEAQPEGTDVAGKVNQGLASRAVPQVLEWGPAGRHIVQQAREIPSPEGLSFSA